MKTLAARFTATYTAVHLGTTAFELRLLPQPLFRYEPEGDDRALLWNGLPTVPPAQTAGLPAVRRRGTCGRQPRRGQETRAEQRDGHRWHYAYSTLVTGPVTARYADQEVFSLERDKASTDPKQPFLLLRGQPVPKE